MSVRTSLYPNAFQSSATLSHASSVNNSNSSAALLKEVLEDKQRELQAFEAIRAQASNLSAFLAAFRDKYSVLNGGSEAVGDVVEHWQNVFRITALTLGSLAEKRVALAPTVESNDPADVVLPAGTLPDKLVRIPVRPADEEEALLAQQQQQQQETQGETP